MTSVPVKNLRGEVIGSVELDDSVFGIKPNRAVVHQAVVAQLANQRKGTHDTKTRGEVRGGTHKMWRQKGTGRARQGDRRAPHWTGGGVVFGPHPRSYHKDLPRKMRRLAMKSALSARVAEQALTVVDELALPEAKTREMRGVLQALGLAKGALIVLPQRDEATYRAARNLEDVRMVTPANLNLLDVLKFRHLVLTRSAADALTQRLTAEISRGRAGEAADDVRDGATADYPSPAQAAAMAGPSVEMAAEMVEARREGLPADVAVAEGAERTVTAETGTPPADAGEEA
ncbi:MAG: 50S ribosomal protein L4 [Chloroflexi bacterium]|nr:50S ribosomal protein L4 [Chloroflexota bacterium]